MLIHEYLWHFLSIQQHDQSNHVSFQSNHQKTSDTTIVNVDSR